MDAPCHHHPDREAAGTCCYCERPLCDECLLRNSQGKSFCRREEECLAYQDDLSSPGEPESPVVAYLIDEYSLAAQEKRLSEVLEELGEVKALLEDVRGNSPPEGSPTGLTAPAPPLEADPRIPGLCAWKLAEEAVSLAGLLSLRVDFIHKEQELSGSAVLLERANAVRAFLEDEAKPKIREYRDWAKPYGDMEVPRLLESNGTQDRKQEP